MGFLLFLSLIYEGSFLKSDPQVPYKCFVAIGKFFIKDCILTFILNVCSILDLFHDVFVILKYINTYDFEESLAYLLLYLSIHGRIFLFIFANDSIYFMIFF